MHRNSWRMLAVATVGLPLLAACGTRDESTTNDSAGGTVAMTDSTGMSTTGSMNETAAGAMDPSMVSFVSMVNQAEIEAGRLATTKARNADVKQYARMMVEEHEKAMTEMQQSGVAGGQTMPNPGSGGATMGTGNNATTGAAGSGSTASGAAAGQQGGAMSGPGGAAQGGGAGGMLASTMTQLQQSQQNAMDKLRSASGAEFDRAYMDSQVAAHQQTLDVLRQHGNSVQNSELRTRVTDMQQDVEQHLRRAQEIANKLGGSTSGRS